MRTVITFIAITAAAVAGMMLATGARDNRFSAIQSLDKTGTTGGRSHNLSSQSTKSQPLTSAGSFDAERTGFEPVMQCYPHTGLANRRYRPLSHLSGAVLT